MDTTVLVNEEMYGVELARRIYGRGALARAISNRWMLGWKDKVRALIKTGLYLELLMDQVNLELDVLVEVDSSQRHLADHEILELAGIPPYPPQFPPAQRE